MLTDVRTSAGGGRSSIWTGRTSTEESGRETLDLRPIKLMRLDVLAAGAGDGAAAGAITWLTAASTCAVALSDGAAGANLVSRSSSFTSFSSSRASFASPAACCRILSERCRILSSASTILPTSISTTASRQ